MEIFAGLIGMSGVRGGNGRILAATGILLAAAGLYHLIRGQRWPRWLIGVGGFAALAFCGYLLIQLGATVKALGGNSMVLARSGPGLWVTAAGALLAFASLFLPSSPASTSPGGQASPSSGGAVRSAALRAGGGRIRLAVQQRTADAESGGARRALQIALGAAWLLDAMLSAPRTWPRSSPVPATRTTSGLAAKTAGAGLSLGTGRPAPGPGGVAARTGLVMRPLRVAAARPATWPPRNVEKTLPAGYSWPGLATWQITRSPP